MHGDVLIRLLSGRELINGQSAAAEGRSGAPGEQEH